MIYDLDDRASRNAYYEIIEAFAATCSPTATHQELADSFINKALAGKIEGLDSAAGGEGRLSALLSVKAGQGEQAYWLVGEHAYNCLHNPSSFVKPVLYDISTTAGIDSYKEFIAAFCALQVESMQEGEPCDKPTAEDWLYGFLRHDEEGYPNYLSDALNVFPGQAQAAISLFFQEAQSWEAKAAARYLEVKLSLV